MRNTLAIFYSLMIFLGIAGLANATIIMDPWNQASSSDELNLYEIWNSVLNDSFSGTSQDLFNTYGVPDGSDHWWHGTNGGVHNKAVYAGYWQSLGYKTSGGSVSWLFEDVSADGITNVSISMSPSKPFVWVEGYDTNANSDPDGEWYSDNPMNSDGGYDHFIAIKIPVALVSAYNTANSANLHEKSYILGFEDLSGPGLGDKDYNDLVVLVDGVEPATTPEPGTLLLLGTGLAGIAGYGYRFRRKRKA